MNTDSLLAVSYIWDLIAHDHAWYGFQLPRVPSIFPDLMIQAGASLLVGVGGWSLFIYSCTQFLLFVIAAAFLVRLMTSQSLVMVVTVTFLTSALVVLADALIPGGTGITFYYFLSCTHFGPFVASMLGSALACKLMCGWRNDLAVFLFIVSALSILSDHLILVSFAIPASLAAISSALLVSRSKMRRAYMVVGMILGGAVAAYLLDTMINRQPSIELGNPLRRLPKFLAESFAFVNNHFLVVTVCFLLPLTIFATFPLLVGSEGLRPKRGEPTVIGSSISRAKYVNQPIVFLWIHAGLAMSAVVTATGMFAYLDEGSYRYLAPVFGWLIVFTAAAACVKANLRRVVYGLGSAAVVFVAIDLVRHHDIRPGPVAWRFSLVDCLAEAKDSLGLKAGFADYWMSRPAMFGSNWSLQINQAASNGHPYIWGNNPYWYIKSFGDPKKLPQYNFIVMKDMDDGSILARFGQPNQVHGCAGGQKIWVYNDSERMTNLFLNDLSPPPGSYLASCSMTVRVGDRLSGLCLKENGRTAWTRLDVSRCRGEEISNRDGQLVCAR